MRWPSSVHALLLERKTRFFQITDDYTWLNPRLTLALGLGSGTVPLLLATRNDYFGRRPSTTFTVPEENIRI